MSEQNNQNNQKKQMDEFNPKLVYEASKKDMELANGQCGACERRGFPLFLVRKSLVPKTFKSTHAWSRGMISLGDREPQGDWQDYHYAYRTLREGYVYILCNPRGNSDDSRLKIMAYEVTHSGAFRLREFRDIKGSRPNEIPKSCVTANHHIKAQFITLDNKMYDKAWIAYSPVRWTLPTVNHYRKHAAERALRFSLVDLTQSKADKISPQGRSFQFDDFLTQARYLLELECDKNTVCDYFEDESQSSTVQGIQKSRPISSMIPPLLNAIRQGTMQKQKRGLIDLLSSSVSALSSLFNQTFYTASHFNSLNSPESRAALTSTANRYESDKHYGTPALTTLVVEDSLGVAEELAVQRRQRLAPVTEGLTGQSEKSEKTLSKYNELVRGSSHHVIYENEKKTAHDELAAAMQVKGGRDKFAQYYQRQGNNVKSYPLSYFTPEINYTRTHYRDIEQYKAAIRSSLIEGSENEAYLFLFYDASQNYVEGKKELVTGDYTSEINTTFTQINDQLNNIYKKECKELNQLSDIDKINVSDVIGESLLAESLGITLTSMLESSYGGYMYCRRLSLLGLTTYKNPQGLGAYKEVILTVSQQKKLLVQYGLTHSGKKVKIINSVKVVHFYNLQEMKDKLADNKLTSDWNKHKNRLNQTSLDNYKALEKTGYQALHQHVDDISTDYYRYLIWLFGEATHYYQVERGAQKVPLPAALNALPFWRNEVLPNSSDMHINFLASFLLIFDSDNIGTMMLQRHTALWGLLFENKQSIYFYLLGDITPGISSIPAHEESYWHRELAAIQSKSAPVSNNVTLQQNKGTDGKISLAITGIDQETLFDVAKGILEAENRQNERVIKRLIEKLVNIGLEGVNKAVSNQVKIDELMARGHFLKVMNLFKGKGTGLVRQYQVTLSVRGLHQYLKRMDELTPFFFNQQMKTDKGTTINVIHNQKGRWHIPQSGSQSTANEKVTLNLLMAFETPEMQQTFEAALTKQPNGNISKGTLRELKSNIIEVSDSTLTDTDIDDLSTVMRNARKQRYIEIFDTSASFVLGGVSLYFQATALQSLQQQLDSMTDSTTKTIMKWKVMSSYAVMTVTMTELLIQGVKLISLANSSSVALYLGRSSNLYTFSNKFLDKIGAIGRVVGVIDSAMTLVQSIKSAHDGNTGAGVYVATSILSLMASGAGLLFTIPVWGQIALIFVGIGLAIITAIHYSDGSDWDEIDKWLNRSMLGNFDHRDIYPPYYLPTPICMQLSQQDYYLAVKGGHCRIEAESSWYDMVNPDYNLYLTLNLPDFSRKNAWFEGAVTIKLADESEITFNIAHGVNQLRINAAAKSVFFAPSTELSLDRKKESYRMDEKIAEDLSEDAALWAKMMAVTTGKALSTANRPPQKGTDSVEDPIGLFLIKQRLGRVKGKHTVAVSVNYWPNGVKDKDGKVLTPYLLSYRHAK